MLVIADPQPCWIYNCLNLHLIEKLYTNLLRNVGFRSESGQSYRAFQQLPYIVEGDQDTAGSESLASFNTAEDTSQVSLSISDNNPEVLALAVHSPQQPPALNQPFSGLQRSTNKFGVPNISSNQLMGSKNGSNQPGSPSNLQ